MKRGKSDRKALIKNDEKSKGKMGRLMEVDGIGEITALTRVSRMPELGKVSNKKIATLVGLAPYCKDSGKKSGKRIIFGGRAMVRSALYMATLSASRFNKPIRAFYKHLINKGKPKKLAITACMRKLLVILNAITKKGDKWNPEFSLLT